MDLDINIPELIQFWTMGCYRTLFQVLRESNKLDSCERGANKFDSSDHGANKLDSFDYGANKFHVHGRLAVI